MDELLTGQPDIAKFDVLSADVKSESGQMGDVGMKDESSMMGESGMKDESSMTGESGMKDESGTMEESGMKDESGMKADSGMQKPYENPNSGIVPEEFCKKLCTNLVATLKPNCKTG